LSCQDHFSASSGTTLSGFSTGLAGSNITRLLKHGELGKTTEMVADSCTAKPWDRSSRSITLRMPPGLPTGMGVGVGTWVIASVFLADFAVSDPAIPTPSRATARTRAATKPSGRIMDASWRATGRKK